MLILNLFGILYLLAGLFYAVYVHRSGLYRWIHFPINVLGGPIVAVYLFFITFFNKKKRIYIKP